MRQEMRLHCRDQWVPVPDGPEHVKGLRRLRRL